MSENSHLRSFSPSHIVPEPSRQTSSQPRKIITDSTPSRFHSVPLPNSVWPDFDDNETTADAESPTLGQGDPAFEIRDEPTMDPSDSESQESIFDTSANGRNQPQEHLTDPTQFTSREASGDEQPESYDLKPPPPSAPLSNIELLADRLFSVDHLQLLLRDPHLFSRFSGFLEKYRPQSSNLLQRFVDAQKAVSAVEYANAIAGTLSHGSVAAALDPNFEKVAGTAVDGLLEDTLPAYITHRLVQLTTETLVKEITGQNTPIMRELMHGLAEVYCLSDPSLPDNPIVYASEEFFRCTQYGRDYAIGRNCRFLQGPRSSNASVARLVEALSEGQEICETILNYRRDGSPFMNLLMIAPLYDNRGTVRYFIGAQVDINGLIEGGRGLDSFERLLAQDRARQRYGGLPSKSPQTALSELSAMWSNEEAEVAKSCGRERTTSETSQPRSKPHIGRKYLGMDDPDKTLWPAPHLGPNGRLPGVFQNYLLVRPFPSLRITFTSPALRIPGLLQSKFLEHVGGPSHIREGIASALSSGIGVTAKIQWITTGSYGSHTTQPHDPLGSPASSQQTSSRPSSKAGTQTRPNRGFGPGQDGTYSETKTRWIHCTPLLGSDERVGVWMIVMVDNENLAGTLGAHERAAEANASAARSMRSGGAHDRRYPQTSQASTGTGSHPDGARMYREYMRREGRSDSFKAHTGGHANTNGYPGHEKAAARTPSRGGTNRSRGQEEKRHIAQQLADRAKIGQDTFKDF